MTPEAARLIIEASKDDRHRLVGSEVRTLARAYLDEVERREQAEAERDDARACIARDAAINAKGFREYGERIRLEADIASLESHRDSLIDQRDAALARAEQAEAERDRLRAIVDEVAEEGTTAFRVAVEDRSFIITGPTGREEDMAKMIANFLELMRLTAEARVAAKTATYWSFDGDTYEEHATEQEAYDRCEGALDWHRDNAADDGWAEEVEEIRWGIVLGQCVETERRDHMDTCGGEDGCDPDCTVGSRWDHFQEFGLTRLGGAE